MATHNVYVNLPWREIEKADVIFAVYENSEKFGTVTISKGAFEWYPSNAKKPYKLAWEQLDRMIKQYYEK